MLALQNRLGGLHGGLHIEAWKEDFHVYEDLLAFVCKSSFFRSNAAGKLSSALIVSPIRRYL